MAGRHESALDDATLSIHSVAAASLTRLWISRPGDLCASCAMSAECADRSLCLHLVRSLGLTTRLDGPFRRFPFGAREVGRVATRLEARILNEALPASGLADPTWLALHRIAGFGAWPLVSGSQCLGVVAVFRASPVGEADATAISATVRLAARALAPEGSAAPGTSPEGAPRPEPLPAPAGDLGTMADAQRAAILAALARAGGRVSGPGGAAELLGMRSTTLESRIRKLGVRKPPRLKLS